MKATIPIVGQAYDMPARQLDAQTCVNWYLTNDPTGKKSSALMPRPALELWADDDGNVENRGAIELNNVFYCVIDDKFYIFDRNGNREEKGTLNTKIGKVWLLVNDFQVFITDTNYGYVYQRVKDDYHEADDFFVITAASSSIGQPTFTGSGLNDMSTTGEYSGSDDKKYRVIIDATGTPDTFKWSDDNGSTFQATGVQITGQDQDLNDGVKVNFIHTTGHTVNDRWDFDTTVDSAFYVPIRPTYLDNAGIYIKQSSGRWYFSEINNFARVNALDFAIANAFPDNLVTSITLREEIWLIGEVTAEPWYDTGAQPFPYQRRSSLIQNYGCIAPFSVVKTHNNIGIWLGQNDEGGRIVLQLVDYSIQIISTEPINREFLSYSKVDDAFADTYQKDGHIFYVLTFPTADKTWVYDLVTKSWCEFKCNLDNQLPATFSTREGRFKANWIRRFAENILCGDFESGKIYKLSDDIYTDNGRPIIFERTTQHLANKNLRVSIRYIEIDIEKGKGLETGQGSNPTYMLQISKDGGFTWSNERWKSGGKSGEYTKRLKWNRLGMGRVFTFRLRVTDPVYKVIIGAEIDIDDEVSE